MTVPCAVCGKSLERKQCKVDRYTSTCDGCRDQYYKRWVIGERLRAAEEFERLVRSGKAVPKDAVRAWHLETCRYCGSLRRRNSVCPTWGCDSIEKSLSRMATRANQRASRASIEMTLDERWKLRATIMAASIQMRQMESLVRAPRKFNYGKGASTWGHLANKCNRIALYKSTAMRWYRWSISVASNNRKRLRRKTCKRLGLHNCMS